VELQPVAPPAIEPPAYVQVDHPLGYTLSDIRAMFTDPKAPVLETLSNCGAEFEKLIKGVEVPEVLVHRTRTLVRSDPVGYHFCFYSKVLKIEDGLKDPAKFMLDRQKLILKEFSFLAPVARAFQAEFQDSRYLRWAIQQYQTLSHSVLHRRVEPTPVLTAELMEMSRHPSYLARPTDRFPSRTPSAVTQENPADLPTPEIFEATE
jgi:hypothetical protein